MAGAAAARGCATVAARMVGRQARGARRDAAEGGRGEERGVSGSSSALGMHLRQA